MIWYQHVYNVFMLSFHVLTHKKSPRGQRKDAPISFWKLKYVFETNPPPSLQGKPSSNCTALLTAQILRPAYSSSGVSWLKICVTLFTAISPSCETLFLQIQRMMLFLDFRGENAEYIRFLMLSLSEELFDLGLITEGRNWLQVMHKCKGWCVTRKTTGDQKESQKAKTYTHSLLLGRKNKKTRLILVIWSIFPFARLHLLEIAYWHQK